MQICGSKNDRPTLRVPAPPDNRPAPRAVFPRLSDSPRLATGQQTAASDGNRRADESQGAGCLIAGNAGCLVCLSRWLPCLSICLSVCLSVCLSDGARSADQLSVCRCTICSAGVLSICYVLSTVESVPTDLHVANLLLHRLCWCVSVLVPHSLGRVCLIRAICLMSLIGSGAVRQAHGTSDTPVQPELRYGCDHSTADKICNFNRCLHVAHYHPPHTTSPLAASRCLTLISLHSEPHSFAHIVLPLSA